MKNLALVLGVLALVACGPKLVFKGTGVERPPKPPTCEFTLVTSPPAEPHEKLGTLDIQYDNTGFLDTPEDLKRKIQPEVCRLGGDAAQGHANSYGTYIKVTVFALQAPAPAETPSAADAGSSGGEQVADGAPGL